MTEKDQKLNYNLCCLIATVYFRLIEGTKLEFRSVPLDLTSVEVASVAQSLEINLVGAGVRGLSGVGAGVRRFLEHPGGAGEPKCRRW